MLAEKAIKVLISVAAGQLKKHRGNWKVLLIFLHWPFNSSPVQPHSNINLSKRLRTLNVTVRLKQAVLAAKTSIRACCSHIVRQLNKKLLKILGGQKFLASNLVDTKYPELVLNFPPLAAIKNLKQSQSQFTFSTGKN